MREQDLVVLRYCHNDCYVELVRLFVIERERRKLGRYSEFKVDLKNRRWGVNDSVSHEIGGSAGCRRLSYAIIGVYNASKIEHLNEMLWDVEDATRFNRSE